MRWLDDFSDYVSRLLETRPKLILCGDFNICHRPIDIHDPVRNATVSGFLPEEREWIGRFIDGGFIHTLRFFHPQSALVYAVQLPRERPGEQQRLADRLCDGLRGRPADAARRADSVRCPALGTIVRCCWRSISDFSRLTLLTRARAQDHTYRHGCVLRVGRTARPPRIPGPSAGRSAVPKAAAWSPRPATRRGSYGIRSAMPSVTARAAVSRPDFRARAHGGLPRACRAQIHRIFREYTDLVEPLALDEAFLDVTRNNKAGIRRWPSTSPGPSRRRIRDELGLVASAGVSYNKFLAQDRFRLPETGRALHDPSRPRRRLYRAPADRGVLGSRPRHGPQDARAGHPRAAPRCESAAARTFSTGAVRQGGAPVSPVRPRHRPATGRPRRRVRKSVGCESTFE